MLAFSRATLPDIEQLQSLAREIWTTCYPGILSDNQIEYMLGRMYSAKNIGEEITSGTIWEIIRFDNEPIGFLALTCTKNKYIKLDKLYLKSSSHGKGFGQESLNYVKGLAKKNDFPYVYLTVNKQNTKAIKAYEKAGFVRTEAVVTDIGGGFVMDDYIYTYPVVPN
jgi:diamine N-acetyltransferase